MTIAHGPPEPIDSLSPGKRLPLQVLGWLLGLTLSASAFDPQTIDDTLNQTLARQEQGLAAQLASPFPSSGLWRYEDFASAAYWLNQQTATADAELIALPTSSDYTDSIANDSFHWHAYLQARIYFLFSSSSSYFPGRMSVAAENAILQMLWGWASPNCKIGMADPSKINWSWGSENHHAQAWVSFWSAAHIFKDHPAYMGLTYADGSTPAQMAAAFDDYFKAYVREKSLKGLAIEVASPTYAKYTLNTWFNLYDFADDPELKEAAGMLLELYWADWAIEQIDGVRGGSRHRCYAGRASIESSGAEGLCWYLFGLGDSLNKHPGSMGAMTTSWRPSWATVGLALDLNGRGSFGYASRRPGKKDHSPPAAPPALGTHNYNAIHPDGGSLLRYTWTTPDFVMGMSQVEALPHTDWWAASSQNRWNGVIFGGHPIARIYTQRPMPMTGSVYNAEWGVQNKGVMILQRLSTDSNATGQMIWFDFSLPLQLDGGWIFAEAPRAYAAIRVVQGGWTWEPDSVDQHRGGSGSTTLGEWLVPVDEFSPIIIEVARKQDYADLNAFKTEILANPMLWDGTRLDYGSVGYGTVLTHFADESAGPWVDAVDLDFSPVKSYDAPHIQGDFAGGPAIIRYGTAQTVLGLAPFADDDRTVALWHFESELSDGSGTYYEDDTSNTSRPARDAREHIQGAGSISVISDGKFGNAVRCDFLAGDQYMMTGSAHWPVDEGTFRYQGWIRLNPGDTGGYLAHVYDQVYLSVDTSTVTFKINRTGDPLDTRECNVVELSADIAASNDWQYIDAWYDGSVIRLVTEEETVSAAGIGTFIPNVRNIYIGARKNQANFVGDMDEVKLSAPGLAASLGGAGSVVANGDAKHFENLIIPTNTISNFTVAPGSNRKLVLTASWEGHASNSVINSVTYGAQSFTEAVTRMQGRNSSIWYLDAPVEGVAQDIVVNFGSASHGPWNTNSLIGVVSLQNAAPGPPIFTDTVAPGSSVNVTTPGPDTFVVGVYTENKTAGLTGMTSSPFANNIYEKADGDFSGFGDAGYQNEPSAGAKTYTWVTDHTSGNSVAIAGFASPPAAGEDLDGDGLADIWEIEHFGSVAVTAGGANEDQDGDGSSDREEHDAGTDPGDRDSLLEITAFSIDSGTGDMTLSWSAVVGKCYRIETKTSLLDPTWTTVVSGIPGVEPVCTRVFSAAGAPAFYRVVVEH